MTASYRGGRSHRSGHCARGGAARGRGGTAARRGTGPGRQARENQRQCVVAVGKVPDVSRDAIVAFYLVDHVVDGQGQEGQDQQEEDDGQGQPDTLARCR